MVDKLALHMPDWSGGNPYQKLLAKGLSRQGWSVRFLDFPLTAFPLNAALSENKDTQVIHLHWLNPYIAPLLWPMSGPRFIAKLMLRAADILLCRLRGCRIVWTVHNRISHDSPNVKREQIVRALIAKIVNQMIFHSSGAQRTFDSEVALVNSAKCSVIPHGNYIGVYPVVLDAKKRLAEQLGIDERNKVVLFFGMIRPYKGIPWLLSAFSNAQDPELRLVIAGAVSDDSLVAEIEAAATHDRRIRTYLAPIPDEEVWALHSLANIVVLPFERTFTSGSVLLAMSLGKPVALPVAARVLDVIDQTDGLFYSDEGELIAILENCHRPQYEAIGQDNLAAARKLEWERIAERTAAVYSRA